MKIENKEIDNFLKDLFAKKDKKIKAILLYGEDISSVNTKSKYIIENFNKINYKNEILKQENLKNSPTLLSEIFYSSSFFSENTLIVLKLFEKENEYTKYIENIFDENSENSQNFVLIIAGSLEKTSSLLKFAEKSPLMASIVCYEEFDSNIKSYIINQLKQNNFIFSNDIVDFIHENIGNNKLIVENEIKKISLYKGQDTKLTLEDVKKCTRDLSIFDVNDIIYSFCSFDKKELFRLIDKFFQEKQPFIIISRSFISYFIQLQKFKNILITEKITFDFLAKRERIFWKITNQVEMHLNKWSLENINAMLSKLLEFEKLKFGNNQTMIENFLLKSLIYFENKKNV